MAIDTHDYVRTALGALIDGLEPFVTRRFRELAPDLASWTSLIEKKDRQAGRYSDRYNPKDVGLLLRALTENFGSLGYPFNGLLSRQASNCASELRTVRNRWAHNEEFTLPETYRALDSSELLLRAASASEIAETLVAVKAEVIAEMGSPSAPRGTPTPATTDAEQEAIESPSTVLTVRTLPALSYALAHNSVPVVDEVTVDYRGTEMRGASVEVTVTCALGPLVDPKIVIADLDGESPSVIRNADVRLDPARMLAVDTPQPGAIQVTLRNPDGDVVARSDHPVDVLSANQWIAKPEQLGLEMLASFVQPNSPAIAAVLREACDLLEQVTGRADLDGYQSGSPERVDAIAAAIYDAIRAREPRYAEPPASWGMKGQKIRTPAEVLDGKLGTCMDTTVTFAAALEEAGINSTLWVIPGHIFLGYWRFASSLDAPAELDASSAMNFVDLGMIALVETTGMTTGVDFASARRTPHNEHLAEGARVVTGVIDIQQARMAQIYPLPSRTVDEHGEVHVLQYQIAAGRDALEYLPTAQALAGGAARDLPARVAKWKNTLLDLSLRNRLINFGERSGYRLAVPQPSLPAFEDMINAGTPVTLLASDRIPAIERERGIRWARDLPESARGALLVEKKQVYVDVTEAAYSSRLRALAYKAKTIVEETGANNLYLAFGMLRWEFNSRELSSPLVLVPVTIEGSARGQTFRLHLDEAGESTPNYCLLEKLRLSFGLEIPGLANPSKDDSGVDLPAAFAATRRALADARLPFTIDDTVDLAILQFAKYRLWRDLDENWNDFASTPLVSHLIHSPTATFEDPVEAPQEVDLDALGASVPVPADSSQLDAVAEAVAGRTFVLEGPPGTGKSQTITNLLAHALANGKRVLFVAEKRAALDVVKKRLDEVGLGAFSLDLHDKGARPTAVRGQIKAALEATSRPDRAVLHAETEVAAASRTALRRYAERLHEPNAVGMSLYSARSHLLATHDDIPALTIPEAFVASADVETLDALRSVLRGLPETADLAHPSASHPWRFVDDPAGIDVAVLDVAAREFDAALVELEEQPEAQLLLGGEATPDGLHEAAEVADSPRFPLEAIDAFRARAQSGEVPGLRMQTETLAGQVPAWTQVVGPEILASDVRAIHAHAVAADASSFFGRRKRQRAVLAEFGAALRVDAKRFPARQVTPLAADIVGSLATLEVLRYSLTLLPIPVVDPSWNPWTGDGARPVLERLDMASRISEALAPSAHPWREALRTFYTNTADDVLPPILERVSTTWRAMIDAMPGLEAAVVARWSGDAGFLRRWSQSRTARGLGAPNAAALERWVAFARHLEPLRSSGMNDARADLLDGVVPADLASLAFDKGIAASSVAERQESQALVSFDVAAHNRTIDRFTSSAGRIRAELPRWIPAEILAKRTVDPNFDGGAMGELKRQLSRQRGGMSVRALFEHYGHLITQLAPCVLTSPESVARFFPADTKLFDIVVFDEASQIRVADAVGAMGRGQSVVVVGDSKQMPPTSFAEVSVDADADESGAPGTVADEESILTECVQARVSGKWLSWHYRSQDEGLISFSNHAYYESRLSSFPAPWRSSNILADDDHGLSLVRVAGHFNRTGKGRDLRTNAVEASAIVDEVARRFAASPHATPSLGVITFNAPQRTLIEALLREHSDERLATALDERDGLFVKNLENVQGDERDVILFSIAFSANDRGYVPLNFGPLSRAGGERRLNVAITRARRQVILFSSFDPAELRAEQTTSVGIKHLKEYLELASSGVESETDNPTRQPVVDRHRDQIAGALRELGFAVRTDVGLSDFRVDLAVASADDPAQPLVAVLLDGEGWRARRTVADRDGLPVDVLQGLMRWPAVERIWLPEWLHQPEDTLARIAAAVATGAAVLERRAEEVVHVDEPAATSAEVQAVPAPLRRAVPAESSPASSVAHPDLRDFVEWHPRRSGSTFDLDSLPYAGSADKVRAVIREVVRTEGPIHKMRLAKLVAESFGLSRVAAARTDAILRCVPEELLATHDRSCVWPEEVDPVTWRIARRSRAGDGRALEHVPLEEIANAMAIVAQLGGGMTEVELKREALAVFGGKRMTEGISDRLDLGIARGVESGRIWMTDSGVWHG